MFKTFPNSFVIVIWSLQGTNADGIPKPNTKCYVSLKNNTAVIRSLLNAKLGWRRKRDDVKVGIKALFLIAESVTIYAGNFEKTLKASI